MVRLSLAVFWIFWWSCIGAVHAFAPMRRQSRFFIIPSWQQHPTTSPTLLERQQQQHHGPPAPTRTSSTVPTRRPHTRLHLSAAATTAGWFIAAQLALGNVGTYAVARACSTWYKRISLPSWTPPDRAFGLVWTTLYTCMGLAASRIYRMTTTTTATSATMGILLPSTELCLWLGHVAVNSIWPLVFFGQKKLRLGLILNVLLVSSMAVILPAFYRVDPVSAWLLLPYTAWLLFATKLNQAICQLNPTDSSGYNQAKLEADIAELQRKAARYAGC